LQAQRSSGSHVSQTLMLFCHQRLLRGAKVLDLASYGVSSVTIWTDIFLPVAVAINSFVDNVHYKADDEAWLKETSKYCFCYIIIIIFLLIYYIYCYYLYFKASGIFFK